MDPLQYLMSANQPAQSPSMLDQMMTGHPSPVNAPYQKGDFQRSGPQMQRSTPIDALMSAFAPQRDEQGVPKPMGAADIINAGLWVLPGMGGRRPISPAAPRIENPIRAYHGSPHDFDKFDISKIGTGEGAQAYGHGLYFAENEGVAKSYRDALVDRDLPLTPKPEQIARQAFEFSKGDPKTALGKLRDSVSLLEEDAGRKFSYVPKYSIEDYRNAVALLDKGWQPPKGKMYEVNINAKPEQMLDWDKPFSQQPATVQAGVHDIPNFRLRKPGQSSETMGNEVYNRIARHVGDKALATQELQQRGIPGIKYLDQGSRGAGQGSSNYVIFNDKLIDIARKYGLAGASPLAALMAGGNDQQAPQ